MISPKHSTGSGQLDYLVLAKLERSERANYLVGSGTTWEIGTNQLQPDINRLIEWSDQWKIKLNPTKTTCLTISRFSEPLLHLTMN